MDQSIRGGTASMNGLEHSTRCAAVTCLEKGLELYRLSAATANEISGVVASAMYIREPTIAW